MRDYVTIVSGLPRSGTSMMMQMIDRGGIPALADNVRGADEDNLKGYYEFEPVKQVRDDSSWVNKAVGKAIKMVHLLLLDLPLSFSYRVVFMRRNLHEVIESQNVMLQRRGRPSDDLPPERLIRTYDAQVDEVLHYMRGHEDNFRFIEANYNKMLADPRLQIERVSALLGGLDTDAMVAVVDPSLYRRRSGS